MPRSDVRPATVLLVEDDAVTRELTAAALTTGGFDVVAVPSGERALLALMREGAAVAWVVTKVDLPGLACGRVVADEYRSRRPDRPVVFTSDRLAATGAAPHGAIVARERAPHDILDILRGLAAQAARRDAGPPASVGQAA